MKKTLLIVDDEPAIRLILKQYLSAEFEIILKSNGREALQWLEEGHHADAIVADYHMPHLDGAAFVREVRRQSRFQHMVIFILSANELSSTRIECLRLGADDYLVKPFNLEELKLRLYNRLNLRRAVA
jgi:DNA-binding response OmpR family regulator